MGGGWGVSGDCVGYLDRSAHPLIGVILFASGFVGAFVSAAVMVLLAARSSLNITQ